MSSKQLLAIALASVIFIGCTSSSSTENNPATPGNPETNSTTTQTSESSSATFSLADVSEHDSAEDCWTVINGKVYNLTPFVSRHPGGAAILQICGMDGTELFTNQPTHNSQSDAELDKLYIGDLAQ